MSEQVDAAVESPVKRMRLRYAGTCVRCGAALEAKAWAFYDRTSKTVHCVECPDGSGEQTAGSVVVAPEPSQPEPSQPEPSQPESGRSEPEPVLEVTEGIAGGSALREYERRSAARQERVRAEHPRIGGLLLALFDDPQSTKAWASGAVGEQRLGERQAKVAGPTLRVLHDRRIPGTKANIDHIVICPAGVYVVDAKRYQSKRPQLRWRAAGCAPGWRRSWWGAGTVRSSSTAC